MTATTLKKHINYLTDNSGQKVAVQLDLKNKQMQIFFEDLLDTLEAIEAYKEPRTSLSDLKKELFGKK
jgi:hypothetical protein